MTIIYFKNLRQLLSLFNVGFAQAGVQLLRPKIEYMWTKNNYTRLTTNLTKNTAPIFSFSPFLYQVPQFSRLSKRTQIRLTA